MSCFPRWRIHRVAWPRCAIIRMHDAIQGDASRQQHTDNCGNTFKQPAITHNNLPHPCISNSSGNPSPPSPSPASPSTNSTTHYRRGNINSPICLLTYD